MPSGAVSFFGGAVDAGFRAGFGAGVSCTAVLAVRRGTCFFGAGAEGFAVPVAEAEAFEAAFSSSRRRHSGT